MLKVCPDVLVVEDKLYDVLRYYKRIENLPLDLKKAM